MASIIKNTITTHTLSDGIFPNILSEFSFSKMINCEGAQGKVGLLIHNKSNEKVVFKISFVSDFTVRHEYEIMRLIPTKSTPHFCKVYGMVKTYINPSADVEENPFSITDHSILADVLLTEYVYPSIPLTDYAYNPRKFKELYSILQQMLIAIEISHTKFGLTHYDLHTDNILVKQCSKNTVFIYVVNGKKYIIQTYGVYPVIIDFGFAYMKKYVGRFYTTMSHTEVGNLGCINNKDYDTRVMMYNITGDLIKNNTKKELILRDKIKGMYSHMKVHPTKGWNAKTGRYSASDMAVYTMNDDPGVSEFMIDEAYDTIDAIQSLITLPIKDNGKANFIQEYHELSFEFAKFENILHSTESRRLVFFQLVDSAYKCKGCINNYKKDVLYYLDKSLKFFNPPQDFNYTSFFKNLWKMSRCIETIYFRVMKDIKQDLEISVPTLDVYNVVTNHMTSFPTITSDTAILLWDLDKETVQKYSSTFPASVLQSFKDKQSRTELCENLYDYITDTS